MSLDLDNVQDGLNESANVPESSVVFDAEANQKIPLTIRKGNQKFDVAIEFAPVSDEEWFNLLEAVPLAAKRIKTVSVELFEPFAALGREKAVARFGYAEKPNWKTATRDNDFIGGMKSYFDVTADREADETKDLLDDEVETPVTLLSNFNGRECRTRILFGEASKAESDEFLAAIAGQPNKLVLAQAKKESKERRLFALYERLVKTKENYANRVPAWHAVEAVTDFFNQEMQRLGKF